VCDKTARRWSRQDIQLPLSHSTTSRAHHRQREAVSDKMVLSRRAYRSVRARGDTQTTTYQCGAALVDLGRCLPCLTKSSCDRRRSCCGRAHLSSFPASPILFTLAASVCRGRASTAGARQLRDFTPQGLANDFTGFGQRVHPTGNSPNTAHALATRRWDVGDDFMAARLRAWPRRSWALTYKLFLSTRTSPCLSRWPPRARGRDGWKSDDAPSLGRSAGGDCRCASCLDSECA
jgi:hypothetical protein